MPQGFALTNSQTGEVFAYSSGRSVIDAVAATPGWVVIGAFFLPFSVSARLDIIGFVSDVALTLRARLFDMTAAAAVPGAVAETTELQDARALSGIVALEGNRIYQIQIECTGDEGDGMFGVLENGTLSD